MRNPNFQQQNAASKDQIRKLSNSFRADPLGYAWIIVALQQAALLVEQGTLVRPTGCGGFGRDIGRLRKLQVARVPEATTGVNRGSGTTLTAQWAP